MLVRRKSELTVMSLHLGAYFLVCDDNAKRRENLKNMFPSIKKRDNAVFLLKVPYSV